MRSTNTINVLCEFAFNCKLHNTINVTLLFYWLIIKYSVLIIYIFYAY